MVIWVWNMRVSKLLQTFHFWVSSFKTLIWENCDSCIKFLRLNKEFALIASSFHFIVKEGIQYQSLSVKEDKAQFALCTRAVQ